ncbi:MAG: isoaspartyl peptidase/L-asparaginase, partial [Rhodothermales bacterium]|nr:isoaspartyl peptidase/L-asparaginase [Rhodothermales bacterium]
MRLQSGSTASAGPCLLIHGGAWAIPDAEVGAHRDGLRKALDRGRALLADGAPALDAATETVAAMEAHGAFDAGRGAVLTLDATVELDAGVMDGSTLRFGAVAAVRRLPQPVRVARRLLDAGGGAVRLLAGEGAEAFADAEGFTLVENAALVCAREQERYERLRGEAGYHPSHPFLAPRGTVGCVVRDGAGRLAAATSTGGTPLRPPGRIGDTPLPGCGFYAAAHAAASATGWGEAIATVLLCGRATDAVQAGADPEAAASRHLRRMYEQVRNREGDGATGGVILLGADGRG